MRSFLGPCTGFLVTPQAKLRTTVAFGQVQRSSGLRWFSWPKGPQMGRSDYGILEARVL